MNTPKFTVCVSVGDVVQFYELTRTEIEDAWETIQASVLPQAVIGWYEHGKWNQLRNKPKFNQTKV